MTVSIIICTRNRAESLRLTLEAIGKLEVPNGWQIEILVVDNASTDHTEAVIRTAQLGNMTVHYVLEQRPGQSFARNTGLEKSAGEIILFTDDDVRPCPTWISQMAAPILRNECDATGGPIFLGTELERPWMDALHRGYLAAPGADRSFYPNLVGANMGFARHVLTAVPGFDSELDAGALGYYGDTLFSWQLQEAGKKIKFISAAHVSHYPSVDRLLRRNLVHSAIRMGQSKAYVMHHWQHVHIPAPRVKVFWFWTKLHLRRLLNRSAGPAEEGCPLWELSYVWHLANCQQYLNERQRPRKYTKRGLKKIEKETKS